MNYPPKDYLFWIKVKLGPKQATLLVQGIFPTSLQDADDKTCIPPEHQERHERILALIHKAVEQGDLEIPMYAKDFFEWARKLKIDMPDELKKEIAILYGGYAYSEVESPKECTNNLGIIGALVGVVLKLGSNAISQLPSQQSLINAVHDMYGERRGFSKRNLESKFAEGKRYLEASEKYFPLGEADK